MLFSSDEEANDARCIEASWPTTHGFLQAIVAEPTRCEAVLAHRGISSVLMQFKGQAGHASGAVRRMPAHCTRRCAGAARALDFVESESHRRFGGLTGLRFNLGRIEGGIKANVIAPSAEVRFGFRPLPSQDIDELHARFGGFADSGCAGALRGNVPRPVAPGGRCRHGRGNRLAARDLADELGLPIGNAVDFWTEASLFSRAGLTALVFGPGDIAQAHTADEWVALEQLQQSPTASSASCNESPSARPPDPPTIVRLLSNMASAKEIQQYLKRFSQLDAARFAVVKVGGAVLRDDLEALTSSLAFLQQVGLTPIVIHGAGPQLDAELAAAGIEKQTINGLRVTSPEALAIVRRVFHSQNLKLVEALQASDARATSILAGVFEADYLDRDTYGLVGEVRRVDLAPIEASLHAGSIPVIASLGETVGGQILNINADFAANELVQVLQPYKIVFLTGTGGLLDDKGKVIDSINLSTEYEHLIEQPWINGGMRVKIEQIKDLLDTLPLTSSVSITKPAELAKELFTHRGSGTLVRRGERVLRASELDELDLPRLRELIESASAASCCRTISNARRCIARMSARTTAPR